MRRPALIDGLHPDEFYLRNADPIALHQEEQWESMAATEQGGSAIIDEDDADCFGHSD